MTISEAIEILEKLENKAVWDEDGMGMCHAHALHMAIEALSNSQKQTESLIRTSTDSVSATDVIYRADAIDIVNRYDKSHMILKGKPMLGAASIVIELEELPSAQPTLYGYPVEHLAMIAYVLQKENFPPERIAEMLSDIGLIVEMVRCEFEETLRKVTERRTDERSDKQTGGD